MKAVIDLRMSQISGDFKPSYRVRYVRYGDVISY